MLLNPDHHITKPRAAYSPQHQMPPKSASRASSESYLRRIRTKAKKILRWKPNRLVRNTNSPDRVKAETDTPHGHKRLSSNTSEATRCLREPSANHITQLAPTSQLPTDYGNHLVFDSNHTLVVNTGPKYPDSEIADRSNSLSGSSDLNHDFSRGFDIVMKLPGDSPEQTQQAAASIDTQLLKVNLMRREIWERLNEDGRSNLEPDDGHVLPMGSERIPVIGVARGLEWLFKNGPRTYTSDFRIIENSRFDVLIGNDTIREYELLQFGRDLRYHLEVEERRKRIERH